MSSTRRTSPVGHSKRCQCRKHFRWTKDGKQYRQKADTRSWTEAEENQQKLADQLAGRLTVEVQDGQTIAEAVEIFLQDKRNQGVTAGVAGKYTRELARLRSYAEQHRVFAVQGITRELLTGFVASWARIPQALIYFRYHLVGLLNEPGCFLAG
jgi:integrase/recombinase XerD